MLLAVDIGNTNIVVAVHDGQIWNTPVRIKTADKSALKTLKKFVLSGRLDNCAESGNCRKGVLHGRARRPESCEDCGESGSFSGCGSIGLFDKCVLHGCRCARAVETQQSKVFDKCVLSSVVPALTVKVVKILPQNTLVINKNMKTGLEQSSIPQEIGADILCNLIAAHRIFPNDYVTVADFGTAFTTATVSNTGQILGVTIAPGLWTSVKALFANTAQIPQIRLDIPQTVLGTDTVAAVRAGVIIGTQGQLEAIVSQIEKEVGREVKLVITGGLSKFIKPISHKVDIADVNFTLEGAKIAFELNC